jgi:hypothetical protein
VVVTFIASYLTTSLPNAMSQNDLQHEVLIENQLARLSALLLATSEAAAPGAQVSQPITLGSAGSPPFAGSDGASVTAAPRGSLMSINYSLIGPLRLPNGGIPNTGIYTSHCGPVLPNGWSCHGAGGVIWNFTAGNHTKYFVNGTGQFSVDANFTTNYSLIAVGSVGGASDIVSVFGNHNTIFVNGTGGATLYIEVVGSNNTLAVTSTGGSVINLYIVGNYDTLSTSTAGGGGVVVTAYGTHDHYSDSPANAVVYFIGFNVDNPTLGLCPYANQANTDTVGGSGGSVNYNDTNTSTANSTSGGWHYGYSNPPPSACPFVVTALLAQTPVAAGFIVNLRNTYSPSADVAFDEGAVVFAQQSGIPIFSTPPPFSYQANTLHVFIPQFESPVASEAGTGTSEASLRLLATSHLSLPSNGFSLGNNTRVTVTIVSEFAAAWYAYFLNQPSLAPYVGCTGPSNVCTATFQYNGPLGVVTLNIPSKGLVLDTTIAFYSFTLS